MKTYAFLLFTASAFLVGCAKSNTGGYDSTATTNTTTTTSSGNNYSTPPPPTPPPTVEPGPATHDTVVKHDTLH